MTIQLTGPSETVAAATQGAPAAPAAPALGEWNEPDGIGARGTLIVIGGRGETPDVYERFGTRLSRDAYRVRAVGDASIDTDAVRAQVVALLADDELPSPKVLIGSDVGASLALEIAASAGRTGAGTGARAGAGIGTDAGAGATTGAVAGGARARVDAVVLAGILTRAAATGPATDDAVAAAAFDSEIEARTACPNHQGVLRRAHVDGALSRTLPPELLAIVASGVGVPLLAIHGSADAISPAPAAIEVYAEAPRAEIHTVVDGRHDILNDVTHRSVAATVVLFLERVKAAPDARPIVELAEVPSGEPSGGEPAAAQPAGDEPAALRDSQSTERAV